MAEKLRIWDTLPSITLEPVGGEHITLPEQLIGDFGVLLFYRGHW
jgi:hypothetical protein